MKWLHGFNNSSNAHSHDARGHVHGVVDPAIFTTERGIWAVKWSFWGLAVTAVFQVWISLITGSVALLADTIHNIGDAATAIPLWFAFTLARKKPSQLRIKLGNEIGSAALIADGQHARFSICCQRTPTYS